MDGELLSIIDAIVRDKGIDREALIQAVESALSSAAKKSVSKDAKEVTVTIDRKRGTIAVVSDGQTVPAVDFSRIGAQTAKQVILQKIREAERDVIIGEYHDKIGTILSGTVHRFERGDIIVDLGRSEGLMPKGERIPYEDFKQGDQIQAYILDVRKGVKGADIILSRANEGFIRGLFALEVPEISDGTVEIKGIAREAGDRTKIAVVSKDEKVDSQGACIGMRGTRVKHIVRELRGERVDVIRWHEEISQFIAAALAPATIKEIQADPSARQALVIVEDDQLSLAIGKKGQNVRLASKLTGWQLEIKNATERAISAMPLREVEGIGPAMEERLVQSGITTVQKLIGSTLEQLTAIKGIGEKTAEKLLESAKQTLASKLVALPKPVAEQTKEPSAGSADAEAHEDRSEDAVEESTEKERTEQEPASTEEQPPEERPS